MKQTREAIAANLLAWIVDLETTDAKQGKMALRTVDNEYCCLGRACEVLGIEWRLPNGATSFLFDYLHEEAPGYNVTETAEDEELPRQYRERFGLTHADMRHCMVMNDEGDRTFPEIAAWLRENVLPRYAPAKASVEALSEDHQ